MIKFFRSAVAFIMLFSALSLGAKDFSPSEETDVSQASQTSQTSQLPPYYDELYELLESSYVFVDLGLSEQDMSVLDQIEISDMDDYNRYGNVHLMKEEIPDFLRDMGNSDSALIAQTTQIIEKIVKNVITASGKETAWVCLRASTPHHFFDIPRWHTDGPYCTPHFMPQFKFATALRGNGTLFYPLTEDSRTAYRDFMRDFMEKGKNSGKDFLTLSEESRVPLSKMFDPANAHTIPKGYGAFFVVAHDAHAALHSEPKFDKPRLFMSIVPGNKCEIRQLDNAWNGTDDD